MRIIQAKKITEVVSRLAQEANFSLRPDILNLLMKAHSLETNAGAKRMLKAILNNAAYAKKEKLAICQDTGLAIVFLEVGQDLHIKGDLTLAVNAGIKDGYALGSLRKSVVADPLIRGESGYCPCLIHTDIVKGNKLKINILSKGFGCENKSQLKMFKPTAKIEEIKKFIVETIKNAGPDACPPYIIGVGIGGTADYACFLAKKALLRKLTPNRYTLYAKLEVSLLKEINKLNIGPMGLGGKSTALAVNIETFPTHIAGLPVAINISCHALRSAGVEF